MTYFQYLNMKKLLTVLSLLALPLVSFATIAVPWNQPTGQDYITPNLVSGQAQRLQVGATGTSTFTGSVQSPCFSNDGVTCISGSAGQAPFTFLPNFGVVNAATSTPIWGQNGFNSSSTVNIRGDNFATTTIGSINSWLTIGGLSVGPFVDFPTLFTHSNDIFDGYAMGIGASNLFIFNSSPLASSTTISLITSDFANSFDIALDTLKGVAYTNTQFPFLISNEDVTGIGRDVSFGVYSTSSDNYNTKFWDQSGNTLVGIKSDGKVAIGTESPTEKLTVNGNILAGDLAGQNTLKFGTTNLFGLTIPVLDPTVLGIQKIGLLNGLWFLKEDPTSNAGEGEQPELGFVSNDGSITSFLAMATTSGSMTIQNQSVTDTSNLIIQSAATTTANVGFDITNGCYAINGVCTGSGSGSSDQNWTIGSAENQTVLTPSTTDYAIYGQTTDNSGSETGQGFGALFTRDFSTTTGSGPTVYTTKVYTGLATTTDFQFTQLPSISAVTGIATSTNNIDAGYPIGVLGQGTFGVVGIGSQSGLLAVGRQNGASIFCDTAADPFCNGLAVTGQTNLGGSTLITGTVNNVGLTVNGQTTDATTYSALFNNQFSGLILGVRDDGAVIVNSLTGSGTKCVHADNDGILGLAAADCGTGSGGGSDFTFLSNFGGIDAATSSSMWFQGPVHASSSVTIQGDDFATTTIGDHSAYLQVGGFDFSSTKIPELHPHSPIGNILLSTGGFYAKEDPTDNSGMGTPPTLGWVDQTLAVSATLSMATTTGDVNFGGVGKFIFGNSGNVEILNSLALDTVTGTTQCLHADSAGIVSGTGSDCGSGGGSTFGKSWEINSSGVLAPTTTISVLVPSAFYASSTALFDGVATFKNNYPLGPGTVPTQSSQLIDLNYANGIQAGFLFKTPVDVLATTTITLSGEQTIDGFTTSASRVLVIGQGGSFSVANAANGCYVSAAGAWTRCTDYDATGEVLTGTTFGVLMGTFNTGSQWSLLTANPVVVGTTPLTFIPTGAAIAGVLPVSKGGTSSTTLTGILKGNGTNAIQTALGGTDYEFPLTFSAPLSRSVNTISLGTVGFANGGTNNTSFAANSIITSNAAGTALIATSSRLTVGSLISTTTATSTFAGGIDIGSGCFAKNGVCITGGGGSGITAIGPAGQTQTGPTVTIATSTSAFNGLTPNLVVTGSGNTLTYTSSLSGTLGVGAGGTGLTATPTFGQILRGTGSGYALVATSTLGIALTDTTGILPIAKGGTNNSTAYTAGSVIFSNGTSLTQDNSNFFWDDTNDRLSLGGATSPTQKLQITTVNDTSNIRLFSSNNGAATSFGQVLFDSNSSSAVNRTYGSIVGRRLVATNALETGQVVINTINAGTLAANTTFTGNKVGVGTSTPDNRLDVQDTFGVTNSSNGQGFLRLTNASAINYIQSGLNETSGSDAPLVFATMKSTTNRMRLDSTGLGIGVVPTEKLDVNGNVNLPTTSSTVGQWKINGSRVFHTFGTDNLFLGSLAGNFTLTTGSSVRNTAVGARTLDSLTTGFENMALGADALTNASTAFQNSAFGFQALRDCTACVFNVAIGSGALLGNNGNRNIAIGNTAGQSTTGDRNILVGVDTGKFIGAFSRNVLIGTESGMGLQGNGNVLIGDLASTSNAIAWSAAIGANATVGLSDAFSFGTSTTRFGFASSSPGTTAAFGTTNGINLSTTATSTFGFGQNIKSGCYAVAGVCVIGTNVSPSLTIVPKPNYITGTLANGPTIDIVVGVNTTASVYQFTTGSPITVNKISVRASLVNTAGTFKLALYEENGQTKNFEVTTASISTTGIKTTTLSSPVTINPGNHYFVIVPVGTASVDFAGYRTADQNNVTDFRDSVTGEPILEGTLAVTAGTMPTTFTPTAITSATNKALVFRLDN